MISENANQKHHLAPEMSDYNFAKLLCRKFIKGLLSYKERIDRPLSLSLFYYKDLI